MKFRFIYKQLNNTRARQSAVLIQIRALHRSDDRPKHCMHRVRKTQTFAYFLNKIETCSKLTPVIGAVFPHMFES